MPVPTFNSFTTTTYSSASSLPEQILNAFKSNARYANTVYPHVLKCLDQERSAEPPLKDQYWIVCSPNTPLATVDLVLSCTEGPMGKYPIFIFSTRPFSQLTSEYLLPRLDLLVKALCDVVPYERVYSVFAPEPITQLFARLWSEFTGIKCYTDDPYYAAKVTFCTSRTFVNRQFTVQPGLGIAYELRPALESDIMKVAELCFGFAAESFPFILSPEGAIKEATLLVRNGQLWVHAVRQPNKEPEIASIVAITRTSETVSTITKVFTNPAWRRRGCAERLVRRVCKHLLLSKETVILYVAHNNPAAASVYHRVGFAGLAENSPPVEGVDDWLELGFDRSQVQLGHW